MKRSMLLLGTLLGIHTNALGSWTFHGFNIPTGRLVELAVRPSAPTAADEVQVVVSFDDVKGPWYVERVSVQVFGKMVMVTFHWVYRPPSPGDIGIPEWPWWRRRVTQSLSLGVLGPGEYRVIVWSTGGVVGSASTSFTVTALEPDDGDDPMRPSWWSSFRSGTSPW